jgi:hypothetical protein
MGSSSADKVWFFFELFRCRTDVYALRWENRRDGRSGSEPAPAAFEATFQAVAAKRLRQELVHARKVTQQRVSVV